MMMDFETKQALDTGEPGWHEECGVVGLWAPGESVASLCYLALFSLQHRGQESAGIAITDGMHIDLEKGMGLMREAFKDRSPVLNGHAAIGHVRYSTFGASSFANIQPILASFSGGLVCLAHNGSLTNSQSIQKRLQSEGHIFQTSTDTEAVLNLIVSSQSSSLEERIIDSLRQIEGAYCLTVMAGNKLIAARDPHGFRPLCLGRTPGGGYIVASESCALDAVRAEFLRDVEPGEMIVVDQDGVRSRRIFSEPKNLSHCVFEYIYFARPDSVLDGQSVWQARYRMGRQLAREFKGEADLVAPVPDTGITAALGFAAESGLPYMEALIKNRYVGRTFILPDQASRKATVEMKLNPIRANIQDKRVVLVDDSIVRGTTSAQLISLIRKAGAREVHFMISSPPITDPCYYGIDTAIRKDLIGAVKSVEEIRQFLGADSLHYLTPAGLMASVDDSQEKRMCTACFSGRYPTDVSEVENVNNKQDEA